MNDDTAAQLSQLNTIWELVEQDASFFLQIVPGILPIATRSELPIRQWVADFLALTFTTPNLSIDNKEKLGLQCLDTLINFIQFDDTVILKSIIRCCCAVYPIIFRYVSAQQNQSVWNQITQIKSRIFQLWDSKNRGIRIACIKFIQTIIQTQTLGTKDPRLINKSDISLNLIMPTHPFLNSHDLEAEAKGFLDRLIENMDPLIITATLNCLIVLAKHRTDINTQIINGILSFSPIDDTFEEHDDAKLHIQTRSLIKNIIIVLTNFLRSNSAGPLAAKINQYLSTQEKFDMQDDNSRKRFFSDVNHFSTKRIKTENSNSQKNLGIPPNASIISLFMLNQMKKDNPLLSIDVTQLPHELVARIAIESLLYVKHDYFERNINILRSRLLEQIQLTTVTKTEENKSANDSLKNITDTEEDDYEPSDVSTFPLDENAMKIRNSQIKEKNPYEKTIKVVPFELPDPQPFTPSSLTKQFYAVIDRLFLNVFKDTSDDTKHTRILNLESLKTNKWNKQSWIRLISRLCTRGFVISKESKEKNNDQISFSHFVRNKLLEYVLSYFKERIQFAVTWLSEEWYNDHLMLRKSKEELLTWEGPQYEKWTLMVLDGILPFVEGTNKAFLRFLSDLPELSVTCIHRLRILCLDPERSKLGFAALHFISPPVTRFYRLPEFNNLNQKNEIVQTYEENDTIDQEKSGYYTRIMAGEDGLWRSQLHSLRHEIGTTGSNAELQRLETLTKSVRDESLLEEESGYEKSTPRQQIWTGTSRVIESLQKEIDLLKVSRNAAITSCESERKAREALLKRYMAIKEIVERLQVENENFSSILARKERTFKEGIEKRKELEMKVEKLEKRNSELEDECSGDRKRIREMNDEIIRKVSQLYKAEKEYDTLGKEILSLEKKYRVELECLSNQVSFLQKLREEDGKHIQRFEEEIKQLSLENVAEREMIQKIQKQFEESQEQYANNFQEILDALRKRVESSEKENEKNIDQANEVLRELNNLNNKMRLVNIGGLNR
ncbi:hypothetical protein PMAC_002500 [Pneumocystis sp. 'macacae']|nr:hypothetical protein PMAC_002500 [Pneumocystis sp. 'macacae']